MGDENKFDPEKFGRDLRDGIHRDIYDRAKSSEGDLSGRRSPIIVGIHVGGRRSSGLFWGALLVLAGSAFLLDNMGIIAFDRLWRFWPLLLVCAGIPNVRRREHRFWGISLIAAGIILQLNELGIAHFKWNDIWPILLILGGLMLMWSAFEARRNPSAPPTSGDPRTTLEDSAIFSGVERRVTSQDFQGGRVTAIFGGVELDLSDANIQGDEATMEINAIFGGIELRIPENWQVAFRGTPLFGGISDKTRAGRTVNVDDPSRKVLVLTGSVIFGGVEIKN